jgi:hypothetical protein
VKDLDNETVRHWRKKLNITPEDENPCISMDQH